MIALAGIVLIVLGFMGKGDLYGVLGVVLLIVGTIVFMGKTESKDSRARYNRREYWANKDVRKK